MKASEVLDQLSPVASVTAKRVEREPSTRIHVTPDMVTMRPGHGKRLLEVDKDEGVKDLFKFLHMPPDMSAKIQPATCGMVANDLLGHHEQFEILMRDGKVVGFRSATQHAGHSMAPERVLDTIDRVIEKPDYNRVIIGESQNVSLEIVGMEKAAVTRGDMIRAGAMVKFSPLGMTNPIVQSFVLRLACTNGMTSTTVLREYSYGNGSGGGGRGGDSKGSVWSWLRKGLKDAYQSYGKVVERYQEMAADEIPEAQRAQVLEAMIRETGLKDEAAAAIRAMAIDNPIRTSYDVLNLLTYATSHILTDARHIHRARRAVEVFQSQDTHSLYCPVCKNSRPTRRALPAARPETVEAQRTGAEAN